MQRGLVCCLQGFYLLLRRPSHRSSHTSASASGFALVQGLRKGSKFTVVNGPRSMAVIGIRLIRWTCCARWKDGVGESHPASPLVHYLHARRDPMCDPTVLWVEHRALHTHTHVDTNTLHKYERPATLKKKTTLFHLIGTREGEDEARMK